MHCAWLLTMHFPCYGASSTCERTKLRNMTVIIAPHPFGHEITAREVSDIFRQCCYWEDRYRQLLRLAVLLPVLPDTLKQQEMELAGCENRVWLGHQKLPDGSLHFYGDSEGRIVRGLLAILFTEIEGKTPEQLVKSDPLVFFEQLGLRQQLSTSRATGLGVLVQKNHDYCSSVSG
jgi:cysteine desulfuration protein SufE